MTGVVLDASALLAMLLDERGGDKVRAALAGSAMTTVTLAEVAGNYARNGVAERDIHLVLDSLQIERVVFDEELAYGAAMLLPATKAAGLSLGARACLALARHRGVTALTADRAWQKLPRSLGIAIEVIR
ncbi:MAG: type II toxin-antitoxin system VapC family toxin [Alphaproteobacteria bacterium]